MDGRPFHLGFCIKVDSEEQWSELGHRSADYKVWDGGVVGGRPSWLDPQAVPSAGALVCRNCRSDDDKSNHVPMRFLCQIYAPIDEMEDRAFHRSLYVFGCPSKRCATATTGSIRILRCQLKRNNPYYPSLAATDLDTYKENEVIEVNDSNCEDTLGLWNKHDPSHWKQSLCAVCGIAATKKCPLQMKFFCCSGHQKEYHKHVFKAQIDADQRAFLESDATNSYQIESTLSKVLPSLYSATELVVEEEPESNGKASNDAEDDEDDSNGGNEIDNEDDSDGDLEQDDLNEMVTGRRRKVSTEPDAYTLKFTRRIQDRPNVRDQTLRYRRWPAQDGVAASREEEEDDADADEDENDDNAAPLWLHQKCQPNEESDIPPCPNCGAPRKFEFQLMPQMLHYLQNRTAQRTSESNNTDRSDEKMKFSQMKNAIQQVDDMMQTLPPMHVSPALVDAKEAAVSAVQQRWGLDNSRSTSNESKDAVEKNSLSMQREQLDQLDWGVVAVYTCTNSCNPKTGGGEDENNDLGNYLEEFAWKQPALDAF